MLIAMVDVYKLEYRDEFLLSLHMHWYGFVKVHIRRRSVSKFACN